MNFEEASSYVGNFFGYNGVTPTPTTEQIQWNFDELPFPQNTNMNGTNFPIPTGSYYPVCPTPRIR